MDKASITFTVNHPGQGLDLKVKLDHVIVWQSKQSYQGQIQIDLDNEAGTHLLEIIMDGKKDCHTNIDAFGHIVNDTVIFIEDMAFDGIYLEDVFVEKTWYQHDLNGHSQLVKDKFFGVMGCNGTVALEFTTPIYLWLLDQ